MSSEAGDGVLSTGECHAAPKGAAGAENPNDPGKHPAAAGGAEAHPRSIAESPGTGHTGGLDATHNLQMCYNKKFLILHLVIICSIYTFLWYIYLMPHMSSTFIQALLVLCG